MDFLYKKRKRLKVSMTPLIDMVFLLLVFFMLTTSFAHNEGLDLGHSKENDGASTADVKFIIISIEPEGVVLVNNKISSAMKFKQMVEPLLLENSKTKIFIQTLKSPNVQDVIHVIDQLNLIGATDIIFIEQGETDNNFIGWGR